MGEGRYRYRRCSGERHYCHVHVLFSPLRFFSGFGALSRLPLVYGVIVGRAPYGSMTRARRNVAVLRRILADCCGFVKFTARRGERAKAANGAAVPRRFADAAARASARRRSRNFTRAGRGSGGEKRRRRRGAFPLRAFGCVLMENFRRGLIFSRRAPLSAPAPPPRPRLRRLRLSACARGLPSARASRRC